MCFGALRSPRSCSAFRLTRFGLLTSLRICSWAECLILSQDDPPLAAEAFHPLTGSRQHAWSPVRNEAWPNTNWIFVIGTPALARSATLRRDHDVEPRE
jgi:hypothetical protein